MLPRIPPSLRRYHGWRYVGAKRSMLNDDGRHFGAADFQRLKVRYGVNWVVVERPGPSDMHCPYENAAVRVCRLE